MITLPSWRHVVREPPHGGPAHGRDYHTHLLPGVDLWGTDLHDPGQLERHILPGLARLDGIGRTAAALDASLAEADE